MNKLSIISITNIVNRILPEKINALNVSETTLNVRNKRH